MDLHLQLNDRRGLASQIRVQLEQHIADGVLTPGTLLPSSREFAARLSVSRATVVSAYERLAVQGLIKPRPGVGYYVVGPNRAPSAASAPASPLRPRELWLTDELAVPDVVFPTARFNFGCGRPAHERFPFARWRALLNDQFRAGSRAVVGYVDPAGEERLRSALAPHLTVSRGVRTSSDGLVITTGTQQAVDLIARVMLEPGDTVAVEHPGYLPAHATFRAQSARVVGVPVDAEGLVVDRLPAEARLVYVTPSHQFPLGMPMSDQRRADLLAWASRHDAVVVEDDYDSEFRFAGRPLTPLQAIDAEGRVLYVGSFSKSLLPALRVGFVAAPQAVADAVRRAKFVSDFAGPGHIQLALAEFIESGDLARYLRSMRRTYERRHYLLTQTLRSRFADVLDPVESSGGIHVSAVLRPSPRKDVDIVRAARGVGVNVDPVSAWGVNGRGPNGLIFGYGAISTDRIVPGLAALRGVI